MMFDGKGIANEPYKDCSTFQAYKLALYQYALQNSQAITVKSLRGRDSL
jgi:hypothetical protein